MTLLGLVGLTGSIAKAKFWLAALAAVGIPVGVITLLFVNRAAEPNTFGVILAWGGTVLLALAIVAPVVGAIRIAKPNSWWAHQMYQEQKKQLARSRFYKSPAPHLRPNPNHPGDPT